MVGVNIPVVIVIAWQLHSHDVLLVVVHYTQSLAKELLVTRSVLVLLESVVYLSVLDRV
jgi:hypothetical protein